MVLQTDYKDYFIATELQWLIKFVAALAQTEFTCIQLLKQGIVIFLRNLFYNLF